MFDLLIVCNVRYLRLDNYTTCKVIVFISSVEEEIIIPPVNKV